MNLMISYSRRDIDEVDAILADLRQHGLEAWKDTSNMQPGEDWRATLLKKPTSVDGFIPFLSNNYIESGMCRMELFLARATERQIFPIMLTECWDRLDSKEETKHISALFSARMAALTIVSLPVSRDQMLARFVHDVNRRTNNLPVPETNVYISYPAQAGPYATQIHCQIADQHIRPWVATLNCEFGSDWRKSQVDAMKSAAVHLIIVGKEFLSDQIEVLRTEFHMSESLGIEVLGIETPDLQDRDLHDKVYNRLSNDDVFRRATRLNWFKQSDGVQLKEKIRTLLPKQKKSFLGVFSRR